MYGLSVWPVCLTFFLKHFTAKMHVLTLSKRQWHKKKKYIINNTNNYYYESFFILFIYFIIYLFLIQRLSVSWFEFFN